LGRSLYGPFLLLFDDPEKSVMADYVKTFVLLAIFLVLAVGNISNIIRHHREKKQAIAEGRIEKKQKRSLFSKKDRQKAVIPEDAEDDRLTEEEEEDYNA